MSLVHDLLQDLDARWQPSGDDLNVLPHSHSVRDEDSLAVPAANTVPAGLSSRPAVEEELGRTPWVSGAWYVFLSGVVVLVVALAVSYLLIDKPQSESMVITAQLTPSEQVLVAEVLQRRNEPALLGRVSAGIRGKELDFPGVSVNQLEREFAGEGRSEIPEVNTVVTPLFKNNSVIELQDNEPTALPVIDESLTTVNGVVLANTATNDITQLSVLVESSTPLVGAGARVNGGVVADANTTAVSVGNQNTGANTVQATTSTGGLTDEPSVDKLLSRASRAFDLQRYREPEGNNAYELYQAVLARDVNNVAALQGIQDVKQAYLDLIHRVIVKNYYYKVPQLAKNARAVGVTQAQIESVIASVPDDKAQPVRDALAQTQAYEQGKRQRKETTQQASGKNEVSVSEQTHDQKTAQQASLLIKDGELSRAKDMLETYIASQPRSQSSLKALFGIYIQQQQLKKAESLIAQAQHLPGDQFSYLVAQLLVQRGDMMGAIRSLTSQQPLLSDKPSYYALMAALYHKLGKDQLSQALYQRLIAYNKTNPSYWLGLAMARDGLRAPAALQAYRQVQRLTPQPVTYSAYVNARIDALSRLQDLK